MREGWEYKKLGEVAQVVSGATPKTNVEEFWGEGHYWVTPAELNDNIVYVERTERQITDFALLKTKLQLLPKGTVLLSSRAPIGKVAICGVDMYCNQGFKNCICSDAIYNKYLFYFLKGKKEYLNSLGRGATFKEISKSIVEKVIIPLPPMQEQKEISAELDQINDLIRLKKEQLKEYDNLAQSIFYDMFGDPVENEKGWEVKKLCDVCTKITDGTHDTPKRLTSGVKFITGKHIRPFHIDYDNSDYVTEEVHKEIYKRCNPEYGDVLYTNIGANFATAAVNVVTYEFSMKNVALLKFDNNTTGFYVQYVLNFDSMHRKIVENYGKGGAQNFLSLKQINSIIIPLPPFPLQQEFSTRIEQIEKLKTEVQKTITDLETLLASRMQYWFE